MDANGLLAVIAILVASYTVLSEERRIDMHIRTSKLDLIVFIAPVLAVLIITYSPVILNLNLFAPIPWMWGFTKETVTFSCLSFILIFFIFKSLGKKFHKGESNKIAAIFKKLLREKKIETLGHLLERYHVQMLSILEKRYWYTRAYSKLYPLPRLSLVLENKPPTFFEKASIKGRLTLCKLLPANNKSQLQLEQLITQLLRSQVFVKHLSEAHPLVAARFTTANALRNSDEFINNFFVSLISNPSSCLYRELRDNQHCSYTGEYYLDESNEILSFFFSDINVAEQVAIWKPIGDYVVEFIEMQVGPKNYYNQPNGRFSDGEERWKCPIFIGTFFFEVMVSAAIFQKNSYHMCLMYSETFVEKILKNLERPANVELDREFPSKFDYLIYNIFSACATWAGSCIHLDDTKASLSESCCWWAAKSTGRIYRQILKSYSMSVDQKIYFLEIVLALVEKFDSNNFERFSEVIYDSIIRPHEHSKVDEDSRLQLRAVYSSVDHVLRLKETTFSKKLVELV